MLFIDAEYSTSCEAAVVVKPKVRLCEPWVTSKQDFVGAAKRRPILNGAVALILTRKLKL
jgi:hypothetical protein